MDPTLFSRLLAEGEGSRLDYKRDVYEFAGAAVDKKAEVLKDILAMANAWRDDDAYILFGVDEVPGRRANVVGITRHLDDADLQQFVNSKTNRPIEFAYREFLFDGKPVAAIRIPLQRRPFHLLQQFGSLAPNAVFIRRGSSTGTADLDEVHEMGAQSESRKAPQLDLQFGNPRNRNALGRQIGIEPLFLDPLPDTELPPPPGHVFGIGSPGHYIPTMAHANTRYYEELREFARLTAALRPLYFVVQNSSSIVGHGVRAELTVPDAEDVTLSDERPERPAKSVSFAVPPPAFRHVNSDVTVTRHGDTWHVELVFGKIQPGQTVWTTDALFISVATRRQALLSGRLFGDEFAPIPVELCVDSMPAHRAMTRKDLIAAIEIEE